MGRNKILALRNALLNPRKLLVSNFYEDKESFSESTRKWLHRISVNIKNDKSKIRNHFMYLIIDYKILFLK